MKRNNPVGAAMKTLHYLVLAFSFAILSGCNVESSSFGADSSLDSSRDNTPQDVTLYWSAPTSRVNGDNMDYAEVGGYEIRYKKPSDSAYQSIIISDHSIDQYSFIDLLGGAQYTFEVAAFDTDGIYSDFVVAVAN